MRKSLVFVPLVAAVCWPGVANADGYLTLMFGRGQLSEMRGSPCTPTPGAVSLWTVANALQARGLVATLPMTADQIATPPAHICHGDSEYANWDDLAKFRDVYHWTAVPRGRTDRNLTQITDPVVLKDETCGVLQTFYQHGQKRAWGLFAWPNNRFTASLEAQYVAPCYAYGRTYNGGVNTLPVTAPYYWANTISVNGGRCVNPDLACHTISAPRQYVLPATLESDISRATTGKWVLMQWYKLVSGSYHDQWISWDCTSTNPANHWSNNPEDYCYNDFLNVINSISKTLTVTDPASVAQATGRIVPHP
jgi:hypothetical protein